MNSSLIRLWIWTLRRSKMGLVALLVGIAMFEFIQPVAIKSFGQLDNLTAILPFIPEQFFALMSISPQFLAESGLTGFLVIGFSHPVFHLLSAATVIWIACRSLVGEMEHGSIQIALSRPVSRQVVYCAAALSTLSAAVLVSVVGPVAMIVGYHLSRPDGQIVYRNFVMQGLAIFLLLAGVAGVAVLISATSDRLGQAVGISIALFVISYVIDYFANLWSALEPIRPLSLFNYYDPAEALTAGTIESRNAVVLLLLWTLASLAGLQLFTRRDLPNE